MNRQQRRAAKASAPKKSALHKLSVKERVDRICQNGITIDDLKHNFDMGVKQGHDIACEDTMKGIYAGVILGLHEEFGFGKERCLRALRAIDKIVMYRLTGEDLVRQVYEKFDVELTFDDPMERVNERSQAPRTSPMD